MCLIDTNTYLNFSGTSWYKMIKGFYCMLIMLLKAFVETNISITVGSLDSFKTRVSKLMKVLM